MKLKRNKIFLIIIHLWIFLTPLVVKAFHHHHTFTQYEHEHNGVVFSENTNQFCPICEYEFSVNGLPKSPDIQFSCFLFFKQILVSIQNGYITTIENLLSPRAPPSIA